MTTMIESVGRALGIGERAKRTLLDTFHGEGSGGMGGGVCAPLQLSIFFFHPLRHVVRLPHALSRDVLCASLSFVFFSRLGS